MISHRLKMVEACGREASNLVPPPCISAAAVPVAALRTGEEVLQTLPLAAAPWALHGFLHMHERASESAFQRAPTGAPSCASRMQHPYLEPRAGVHPHPRPGSTHCPLNAVHTAHVRSYTQAMQLYTNAMVSFLKANMSCNDQGIHIYMLHKLVLKGRTRFKWVRGDAPKAPRRTYVGQRALWGQRTRQTSHSRPAIAAVAMPG